MTTTSTPPTLAQVHAWDNLLSAYHKASRGKRGWPPAASFEYYLEDNLIQLQEELAAQTYHPGLYRSFYIHEPKRRLISAAPFCDRVVHHALCQVIEPLFERSFIEDSYANRVGKGTHRALDRCQQFARRYRLFGDDRRQMWAWKGAIIGRLARLRLTIHETRAQVRPVGQGIPFLGFIVFPQQRRLKRRKGIAYRRRLKGLLQDYASGEISLDRVTASVQGWVNHARYGNTEGLRRAMLGSLVIQTPRG